MVFIKECISFKMNIVTCLACLKMCNYNKMYESVNLDTWPEFFPSNEAERGQKP